LPLDLQCRFEKAESVYRHGAWPVASRTSAPPPHRPPALRPFARATRR
jgi:hypothetical protein